VLAAAIGQARAIVVPSECHENAPLALLEAYAAGRPVIGSHIAGIPELVREDETGVLYQTGDPAALAEALSRFAALPDARVTAMGTAGRAWVERDFNATVYLGRQLDLYGSLSTRVR
jgi:glycosyltransferase involved in cell wall biosynthesis